MTQLRQKMVRAMELKNLSSHTQRAYLAAVTAIAKHYHKSPQKITKVMIEDYLLYLKNDKGNAPNSCAGVLTGLRFFYNNVTAQHIPIDYRARKKVRKLPCVLTQSEIWRIICAPKNLKHRLMLMATYSAGLRASEVIALKPGDIDFNGNFIEVRRSCVMGKVATTKSGKIRRVDMSNGLSETLKQHLVSRKKEALRKGWGEPPELLFYNEAGSRIDINHLRRRVFYKCLEKAGLRRIRIHDLRHTYATLRISKGDNILDVSKQLGHHSIKITIDTYAHWMPGGKKSEVDELDGRQAPGIDEGPENAEVVNG